jgi:transposase-like protein
MDSKVYFLLAPDAKMVKIGVTTDLPSRMQAIQACSPVQLTVVATIPGDEAVESAMHLRFASSRAHFEWFRLTPELARFIEEIKAGAWAMAPRPAYVEMYTVNGRMRATPDLFFRILALAFGNNLREAARRLGVAPRTVHRWKADAEQGICTIPQTAFRAAVRALDAYEGKLKGYLRDLRQPAPVTDR